MFTFAKIFECKHGFPFAGNILRKLKASNFLPGASLAPCLRQILIDKIMLRCPEMLKFVQEDANEGFSAMHLNGKTLLTPGVDDTVLLLRNAQHCLRKTGRTETAKSIFFNAIHMAEVQYVIELAALFPDVHIHNYPLFASYGLYVFLDFQISSSKCSKTMIDNLDDIANGKSFFGRTNGGHGVG